jgi:hypothetical protein
LAPVGGASLLVARQMSDRRWLAESMRLYALAGTYPPKSPLNLRHAKVLVVISRLVAIARGEQEYFDPSGIPTATEACKSNALMRCCKDLGIASELWYAKLVYDRFGYVDPAVHRDPRYIREFKVANGVEVFAEHATTKKKCVTPPPPPPPA